MATTFSELFTELKAEAEAAWAGLVAFEHTIVPIVEADVVAVLSQFKNLAIKTVLNLATAEMAVLSGAEKQSTVVVKVFQATEAAGKQIAIEDVRAFAQHAFDAVAMTLKPK